METRLFIPVTPEVRIANMSSNVTSSRSAWAVLCIIGVVALIVIYENQKLRQQSANRQNDFDNEKVEQLG